MQSEKRRLESDALLYFENTAMLRILHLSDIHFGQEKKGERIRPYEKQEGT